MRSDERIDFPGDVLKTFEDDVEYRVVVSNFLARLSLEIVQKFVDDSALMKNFKGSNGFLK